VKCGIDAEAAKLLPSPDGVWAFKTKEDRVRHQIENLVAQMHESGIGYAEAVREFKRRFILNVLERNKGNQSRAARELGMHRNTLSRTLAELDINGSDVRSIGRRPPTSERPLMAEKKIAR